MSHRVSVLSRTLNVEVERARSVGFKFKALKALKDVKVLKVLKVLKPNFC